MSFQEFILKILGKRKTHFYHQKWILISAPQRSSCLDTYVHVLVSVHCTLYSKAVEVYIPTIIVLISYMQIETIKSFHRLSFHLFHLFLFLLKYMRYQKQTNKYNTLCLQKSMRGINMRLRHFQWPEALRTGLNFNVRLP